MSAGDRKNEGKRQRNRHKQTKRPNVMRFGEINVVYSKAKHN